jgi:hypothetical protein
VQGVGTPKFLATSATLLTDSSGVSPTRWIEGGVIGAVIGGMAGAGTALGLSDSRSVGVALLGFVPGAMIGFTVGALVGGQFPKHR